MVIRRKDLFFQTILSHIYAMIYSYEYFNKQLEFSYCFKLTTPMPSMANNTVAKNIGKCSTGAINFMFCGDSVPLKM